MTSSHTPFAIANATVLVAAAVAANTYERNVMYGTEAKAVALKNNCGKLNWHVNNVVHRGRIQCTS